MLYKKLANATIASTFSDSTFNIQIYFEQLFSMANYKRATGEAQVSTFVTLSSKEFYSNQYESFRLCVTEVRGTPKLNLTKFWFNSEKGMWLPTGKNFYFSTEAWGSLVKQITKLNAGIQKMGLLGMRVRFIARLNYIYFKQYYLLISPDTYQLIHIPYLFSQFRYRWQRSNWSH